MDFSKLEFQFNSIKRPKDWVCDFDAHIYFDLNQYEIILNLQKKIKESFSSDDIFVGDIIPKNVGPHLKPMMEVNFKRSHFTEFVLWLMDNRGPLSILVHKLSDNDFKDHTSGALWLGKQVALDYDKFN